MIPLRCGATRSSIIAGRVPPPLLKSLAIGWKKFHLGGHYKPQRLHQILATRGIRGLLLPPQRPHPDWGEYSVVRFGRSLQNPRTHLATADQVANTMLAFEEIQKRGYSRIRFVTDEVDLKHRGHLFEGGYLMAQRQVAEAERLPVFVMNKFSEAARKKALAAWLKKAKADAIFTHMAEVPHLLKSMGISVPEDVALVVEHGGIESFKDDDAQQRGNAACTTLLPDDFTAHVELAQLQAGVV